MNQVALLLVLLVVAYFGGALRSEQARFGMASGIEYVLLGIVLGPHLLGVLTSNSIQGFEPLLLMAVGWLATALGMGYGLFNGRRVAWSHFAVGSLLSALTCGVIFLTVAHVGQTWGGLSPKSSALVGLASGAVSAGSGHHAVNWAMRSPVEDSPLKRLLSSLGNVDDLPPLLALSGLVVLAPPTTTRDWSGWQLAIAGLSFGTVLGAAVAALLGPRLRRFELWPVLVGAVLLVVGIVLRLGMPMLAPVFLLGIVVTLLSPHRTEIRKLVLATERPLLLPTLLLAGALVEAPHTRGEWLVVLAAVLARIFLQFFSGFVLSLVFRAARGQGTLIGQALLPSSCASLAMGLVVYLARPGEVGRLVLVVSVAATLVGEVLGARALYRLAALEQENTEEPRVLGESV